MRIEIETWRLEVRLLSDTEVKIMQPSRYTKEQIKFFRDWHKEYKFSKAIAKKNLKYEGAFWNGELKGCIPTFPDPDTVHLIFDSWTLN